MQEEVNSSPGAQLLRLVCDSNAPTPSKVVVHPSERRLIAAQLHNENLNARAESNCASATNGRISARHLATFAHSLRCRLGNGGKSGINLDRFVQDTDSELAALFASDSVSGELFVNRSERTKEKEKEREVEGADPRVSGACNSCVTVIIIIKKFITTRNAKLFIKNSFPQDVVDELFTEAN